MWKSSSCCGLDIGLPHMKQHKKATGSRRKTPWTDSSNATGLQKFIDRHNQENYYDKHPEKVLPLLHYTVEESNKIQQAVTNIPDYVNQSMARFITGDLSIDTDWDTYLSNLENMGLSQWLETAQEAYNRSL